MQAELYAKSQGWLIVGLYVANAGLEDVAVPVTLGPAVDALRSNCPQGCVLVVSQSCKDVKMQCRLTRLAACPPHRLTIKRSRPTPPPSS